MKFNRTPDLSFFLHIRPTAVMISLLRERCPTPPPPALRKLPESGVPQETAPQEWLAAPASPGLLARLLAAVLRGGPRGEERGAGEEEEGRAGEGAGKGEVRQPPRRFVESSIGDLHCSFPQGNALWETSGVLVLQFR